MGFLGFRKCRVWGLGFLTAGLGSRTRLECLGYALGPIGRIGFRVSGVRPSGLGVEAPVHMGTFLKGIGFEVNLVIDQTWYWYIRIQQAPTCCRHIIVQILFEFLLMLSRGSAKRSREPGRL